MSALLAAPGDGAASPVVQLEEQGFAAVATEHWCDAVQAFLGAHALAPLNAYLLNAAQAAERAGDLTAARDLYRRAVPTLSDQEAKLVAQKIGALEGTIRSAGAGTPCRSAEAAEAKSTAVEEASAQPRAAAPPPEPMHAELSMPPAVKVSPTEPAPIFFPEDPASSRAASGADERV